MMVYSHLEISSDAVPEERDTAIAARTASMMIFVAALWFFVSPWAYYGVSDQQSAWNCWIVGMLMLAVSTARAWYPLYSAGLSWVNAVLAVWVLVSPWIYGYSGATAPLINSLCVGSVVLALSIAAAKNTRGSDLP
jgi:SPW repeat